MESGLVDARRVYSVHMQKSRQPNGMLPEYLIEGVLL